MMDFQRIFILMGLAVTAYMLVLAWNEDYGSNGALREDRQEAPLAVGDGDEVVVEATNEDFVPSVDTVAEEVPTIEVRESVPTPSSSTEPDRLIKVTTDVLSVEIDLKGGDIVSVSLPAFPTSLETPDQAFVLVDAGNSYTAQTGLIGPNGTDTAAGRPTFVTDAYSYDLGESQELVVALRLQGEQSGIALTKRFRFTRSDYLISIEYQVNNQSAEDWSAAMFAQIKRDSQEPSNVDTNVMGMQPFIGAATWTEDVPYQKLEFDDVEDDSYRAQLTGGYMAMVQHYFITAFVPAFDGEYVYQGRKLLGRDVYLFGFTSPVWQVPAGSMDTRGVAFYAGPKDQYRLQEIAEGLDLTIDYGFLWWLAQPLFYLLTFIQGFVTNWGVAIMLLTLIVKLILYPLSAASFRSNAKLRKLQPQMVRLKEQYGDDRQKFSQEMMGLYQKEGANPLGGCLPLLLQMPVFLALYWVLLESVEIRQAPFMLWIHDLSAMDPYFVLPILMGISMYLVTMMQPEPPDPMQAKIFKMMPIMFTFFFLWFPAGLVLYWLVNNVLSLLQQWYVTRQLEASSGK